MALFMVRVTQGGLTEELSADSFTEAVTLMFDRAESSGYRKGDQILLRGGEGHLGEWTYVASSDGLWAVTQSIDMNKVREIDASVKGPRGKPHGS